MKTKYVLIVISSLCFSASGFAQTSSDNTLRDVTSSRRSIDTVQLKSGPLADFYELVSQYQLPKQTSDNRALRSELKMNQIQLSQTDAPAKLELEIANSAKTVLANKP
jgi:hypothetical protein